MLIAMEAMTATRATTATAQTMRFIGMTASSRETEAHRAEVSDGGGEPVARLEPHLLLLRIAADHALGGAGVDDVARLERHELRGVRDDLRAIEDHVVGVRRLAHLAVDGEL